MSDPFTAEIRMFAGPDLPDQWLPCDGRALPISQHSALYSILGTTYGGDGTGTFCLPDLGGRSPVQSGHGDGLSPRALGDTGGAAEVTLTEDQMPKHTHPVRAVSAPGDVTSPAHAVWAQSSRGRVGTNMYSSSPSTQPMHPDTTASTGGGQPHNNLAPYLVVTFGIALVGVPPAPGR